MLSSEGGVRSHNQISKVFGWFSIGRDIERVDRIALLGFLEAKQINPGSSVLVVSQALLMAADRALFQENRSGRLASPSSIDGSDHRSGDDQD